MKAKRFTEEQIIAVLKESEAGAKTKELCRRHEISEATYSNWKAKYRGMTVSEATRLKELEAEKLKRLLADSELDKAALKELLAENSEPASEPPGRRRVEGARPGCDTRLWAGRHLPFAVWL